MKYDEIVIDPKNYKITVRKLVIDHPATFRYLSGRNDIDSQIQSAIILGVASLSAMDLPVITNPISDDGVFTLTQEEIDRADES